MDGDVEFLVEAIEDSFGVKFNQNELTDGTGFDDLCRIVAAHLGPASGGVCFSSITCWRLRRAWIKLFGLDKASIKPSTSTELMMPLAHRRQAWRAMSETSGLRLPRLEYPDHLNAPILITSVLVSIVIAISGGGAWWLAAAVVAMPFAASLLFFVLRPFADILPAQCHTLGDLAKVAVGLNYGRLVQKYGPSNERQIAEGLRRLVADLTDIDPYALIGENPRLIDIVIANDGFRVGA